MTKILLTCKCSECDGGVIHKWNGKFKKAYRRTCKSCNGGKTVMVFDIQRFSNDKMIFDHETGKSNPIEREWYRLFLNKLPFRIIHSDGRKDVTKSINPLYLETIEQQECPDCGGMGYNIEQVGDAKGSLPCHCTEGKIEVVTQFTVFGSKEEWIKKNIKEEFHLRWIEEVKE